jgi:aryl-alcohol dehydrogenase-like predicted oxidoreductase
MGKFVAGDVQVAIQQCIVNGIWTIETSSSYGRALRGQKCSAHDIVRECIVDAMNVGLPEPNIIEVLSRRDLTTLRNLLFRPTTSMVNYMEQTLGRLGLSNSGAVDMFIVPKYWGIPNAFIVKALMAQMESGQTNHIGVAGVTRVSTLRTIQEQIQNLDYTLSANVFPFSLTNQKYFYMIQVCKDLGIVPLIRDPLDGGLASGVYTAMNPSGGMVSSTKSSTSSKFTFAQLEKLQPLHSVQETLCDRVRTRLIRNMRTIQDKYSSLSRYSDSPIRDINTDITTTQIAIQYVIAKGGVPMVPVNNPIQAEQVLGCLGWTLTDDEVAMLDSAIALCKLS